MAPPFRRRGHCNRRRLQRLAGGPTISPFQARSYPPAGRRRQDDRRKDGRTRPGRLGLSDPPPRVVEGSCPLKAIPRRKRCPMFRAGDSPATGLTFAGDGVPRGCTFAQAPDEGRCEGILAWHVREGHYGDVALDGLNLVGVGGFEGNLWTGEATNSAMGFFIDERADEGQREALQAIFGGQAGGWPAGFAELIDEVRGIEFAPIDFEIADDLAHWRGRTWESDGKSDGADRADRARG